MLVFVHNIINNNTNIIILIPAHPGAGPRPQQGAVPTDRGDGGAALCFLQSGDTSAGPVGAGAPQLPEAAPCR